MLGLGVWGADRSVADSDVPQGRVRAQGDLSHVLRLTGYREGSELRNGNIRAFLLCIKYGRKN